MKKRLMGVAVAAAGVVGLAIPAAADEVPRHGHVKLLGVDEATGTYRRCIDYPAGRGNSWKAHHYSIHKGTAGEALYLSAGHAVIPTNEIAGGAPVLPANCADVDRWLSWYVSQPPSDG
jgi:hypothetical protein